MHTVVSCVHHHLPSGLKFAAGAKQAFHYFSLAPFLPRSGSPKSSNCMQMIIETSWPDAPVEREAPEPGVALPLMDSEVGATVH